MNAATIDERLALIPAFSMPEAEWLPALSASVFPGAKPESVRMAVAYCRANLLDPFLKPVHIVPMRVKTGDKNQYGEDEYAMRDVVMPGVGLYRIQASRTGAAAGMDPPEYGPAQTMSFKELAWYDTGAVYESGEKKGRAKYAKREIQRELVYPEWCRVTVYRFVNGVRCSYTAEERWLENYATAGRDTTNPNAMWTKRPYGQLSKCAEAQAWRKGFPEVGQAPTAEEMEGKVIDEDGEVVRAATPEERVRPSSKSEGAAAAAAAAVASGQVMDVDTETGEVTQGAARTADPPVVETGPPATPGALKLLRSKMASASADEAALCAAYGIAKLDELPASQLNSVLAKVKAGDFSNA